VGIFFTPGVFSTQAREMLIFVNTRIKMGYFLVSSMARSLLETVKDIERETAPL
jgi:hypothetical protein